MRVPELTDDDVAWLEENYEDYAADEDWFLEGGSYDVMTSIGYVGLWNDGEVTWNGMVIYQLDV